MEAALVLQKLEEILQILREERLAVKRVLNLDEAAKFTGMSTSHLYKLTSQRRIPHSKPRGKTIFFNREELEEWLLENKQPLSKDFSRAAADYNLNKGR